MKTRLYFVHALSPLQAGTGQGVDAIDLPIAREKATNLPIVPGSSVKGVLRAASGTNGKTEKVFGPETRSAAEYAGSISISDACLLVLPVRSLAGTFAWVSSPYVLRRLLRDVKNIGSDGPGAVPHLTQEQVQNCLTTETDSALHMQVNGATQVYLEELDLLPQTDKATLAWADWLAKRLFPDDTVWQTAFRQRFCIVHDDVYGYLLRNATEITARIRLKDGEKTVADGGLWYEESLPTESILWGVVASIPVKAEPHEVFDLLAQITKSTLQFGGGATVGRGLCRMYIDEGN